MIVFVDVVFLLLFHHTTPDRASSMRPPVPVVFGRVLEGKDVVTKLRRLSVTGGGKPVQSVVIADCGLVT